MCSLMASSFWDNPFAFRKCFRFSLSMTLHPSRPFITIIREPPRCFKQRNLTFHHLGWKSAKWNRPLGGGTQVPAQRGGAFVPYKRFEPTAQNLGGGGIHFRRAFQFLTVSIKNNHTLRCGYFLWWRRGESNPRPKTLPREPLRAQTVVSIPAPCRKPSCCMGW